MHSILVVSDSTGRTAELTLKAVLTQFPDQECDILLRPQIRSEQQILEVVQEAAHLNGLIIHTLVSHDLRTLINRMGKLQGVETIDILGAPLNQLSSFFSHTPAERPGLFREINEAYFRRIEAVEFSFRHDDGQRIEELDRAELILVGVSRTFKTPLSIYLAFKGWFVCNIPIILDVPPPAGLLSADPNTVVALIANAPELSELRRAREKRFKGATGQYANLRFVRQELAYALALYNRHPRWTRINVTNKPIEEIATEIVTKKRGQRAGLTD